MPYDPSPGLVWRRLDLHVHTPASADYTGPHISPSEFVAAALSKGLDAIAITDHNTAAWVDDVIAAAQGTVLTIIPGVEITASAGDGVHIIALFDTTASAKTVESLLAKVDIAPESWGKEEAVSPLSPLQVIDEIADLGGLAILAHADSSRGALKVMKGQPRILVVKCPHLAAVEVVNYVKTSSFLDGTDPDYQRKLATYRSSDNPNPDSQGGHSADGIGSRYSWFKVDGITLDALAQCFRDPDVRMVPDTLCPQSPGTACPSIRSVVASQGFLDGQTFVFHEGLNSIIGGAGVGKSLVIEFLRFALDQPSPIDSIAEDMKSKVDARLGLGGLITVTVSLSPGQDLVVRRQYDGLDNPITVTRKATGEVIPGSPKELFPILAYSQTEALAIAQDPRAQLKLIDSFLETGPLIRRMAELRGLLGASDKNIAKALKAESEVEELDKALAVTQERLAQVDIALKSEKHELMTGLEPKSEFLASLNETVADLGEDVGVLQDAVAASEVPKIPKQLAGDKQLSDLRQRLTGLRKGLQTKAAQMKKPLVDVTKQLEDAAAVWEAHVEERTKEYYEWANQEGGDRTELAGKRKILTAEISKLKKRLKVVRAEAENIARWRSDRSKLLSELDQLDQELYELRKEKYDAISRAANGRLSLRLERHGDKVQYGAELSRLKRGSNLHESTINLVIEKVPPRELIALVFAENVKGLASRAQITGKQAQRLISVLLGLEATHEVLAMEYLPLEEDQPSIWFRKDDGTYHELASVSIGQKSIALLIVALVEGEFPVVIDQPEDALDTTSVYADVTIQLRAAKTRRQFILTTHNSTVAVASDSDQFHVLEATADAGKLTTAGAMDRPLVMHEVVRHLEGGDEPLALKTTKYKPAFKRLG